MVIIMYWLCIAVASGARGGGVNIEYSWVWSNGNVMSNQ